MKITQDRKCPMSGVRESSKVRRSHPFGPVNRLRHNGEKTVARNLSNLCLNDKKLGKDYCHIDISPLYIELIFIENRTRHTEATKPKAIFTGNYTL